VTVAPRHRALLELTHLPTVAGREDRVIAWVERWARRRRDVRLRRDRVGNLLLGSAHRRRRDPVVAVAHMDHPGFVIEGLAGRTVTASFLGGVKAAYFESARVEWFDGAGASHRGRAVGHDPETGTTEVVLDRTAPLASGDLGRWWFPARSLGPSGDRLRAPGCDDLAGVAAVLAALDRTRRDPALAHFGVLLTRGEEEGLLGAVGACREGALPPTARILSVETSRSFADSPLGAGPVVRVGDAATVFSAPLTNRITEIARSAGRPFQRKLMAGGTCEASAFVAFGLDATGLCLPLENYHNMADIDGVAAGTVAARLSPEEISLADFDGLVALLVEIARSIDGPSVSLADQLSALFEEKRHLLG
jgi:putative aminopeptidase FrvX